MKHRHKKITSLLLTAMMATLLPFASAGEPQNDIHSYGSDPVSISDDAVQAEDSLGFPEETRGSRVVYHGNGATEGTVPVDEKLYNENDVILILDNSGELFREGHVFTGWNTAQDGSGALYLAGDTLALETDVDLFACWAEDFLREENQTVLSGDIEAAAYQLSAADHFGGGSGTEEDPYLIADFDDLLTLSNHDEYWDQHFKQTASLEAPVGTVFRPIGGTDKAFSGTYDGQGYAIGNLSINLPDENSVGLFGRAVNATISNVTIHGDVTGSQEVGGLVGYLAGEHSVIENVHTNMNITATKDVDWAEAGGLVGTMVGGAIHQCSAQGNVTGSARTIGGLVGFLRSSQITSSYASGNVSIINSPQGSAGGLVGTMDNNLNRDGLPLIEDCYATGAVHAGANDSFSGVGGLVGRIRSIDSRINRSYATGSVVTDGGATGGLVGYNTDNDNLNVTNSFWDTQTSGRSTSAGGTGKESNDMQTEATFSGAGWQFPNSWHIDESGPGSSNGGYPTLVWQGLENTEPATDPLQEGLIAYWSFDDDFSADVGGAAYDFIGYGTEGIPEQGQFSGRKAVKLQRTDSQHLVTYDPAVAILQSGDSFTYMAWYYLKEDIASGDRYFVLETNVGFPLSYGLRSNSDAPFAGAKGQVHTQPGGNFYIDNEGDGYGAVSGKWYNIIVTYNKETGDLSAFLNGTASGSLNSLFNINDFIGLVVGAQREESRISNDFRFWEGYIDEIALWNRALTHEEITHLQTTQIFGDETYRVVYDGNGNTGGSIPVDTSLYEADTVVTIIAPPEGFVRENYLFAGWNTRADGSGITYHPEDVFPREDGDMTLYAQWELQRHTVTFNSNGGSAVADQSVPHGGYVTQPADPVRSGHRFIGWYRDSGFTQLWDFQAEPVTEDTLLVARWQRRSSGSDDDISDTGSLEEAPEPETEHSPETVTHNADIWMNGESYQAAKVTISDMAGTKVIRIVVDAAWVPDHIANEQQQQEGPNELRIPVEHTGDSIKVVLTGELVKLLEDNRFDVCVKNELAEYRLAAKAIGINEIAETMGIQGDELASLEIEISISKLRYEDVAESVQLLEAAGLELMIEPIRFELTARQTSDHGEAESIHINPIKSYAARTIRMPGDLDPGSITTGILLHADGTYGHVPTKVLNKEGVWFAEIHSLKNAVYSVIRNTVQDHRGTDHWTEKPVNDMAARLVLSAKDSFEPDKGVNRGELATYIARALGIYGDRINGLEPHYVFQDIEASHPNAGGIMNANQWGLMTGYPDGTFQPNNSVTREEAMTVTAKMMNLVHYAGGYGHSTGSFNDIHEVSPWAYDDAIKTIRAGIFIGRSSEAIAPKETLTHGEALAFIRKLLVKAELINP